LRYINGVERGSSDEQLDKWVRENAYTPAMILHSLPGSSAQTTVRLDDLNRIQVTLGHQESPINPYGTFILDIDRIMEDTVNPNVDLVLKTVANLHDDVWEVFQLAKNDSLERLLQGKLL
jgi:uncharacterized protein (TIGR04255 family)